MNEFFISINQYNAAVGIYILCSQLSDWDFEGEVTS